MSKILQLKIYLQGSKPQIWRRFLVEDSIIFDELHETIQEVMGWESYHLYGFKINGINIEIPSMDYYPQDKDAGKTKLSDLLNLEKQRFNYVYDFGDGWNHVLVVEKILKKNELEKYPVCIEGKMACPPE
ncbi:MAG: plasmid pRiA4b ORF-3 family protein, partial [archaeon]